MSQWAAALESFATWVEGGLLHPESEGTLEEAERRRMVRMMRACAADWRAGRKFGGGRWGEGG